jgi:hypothetical protein
MYIGVRVKYPLYLSDFNEALISGKLFEKYPHIKLHENPPGASRVVLCWQTDWQTWRSQQSLFANLRTRLKIRTFRQELKFNPKQGPLWGKGSDVLGLMRHSATKAFLWRRYRAGECPRRVTFSDCTTERQWCGAHWAASGAIWMELDTRRVERRAARGNDVMTSHAA